MNWDKRNVILLGMKELRMGADNTAPIFNRKGGLMEKSIC